MSNLEDLINQLPNDFNTEIYKFLNCDLSHLDYNNLIAHYCIYGKNENRKYKLDLPYDFNHLLYKYLNTDLSHMNEIQLKIHYFIYGRYENRIYNSNKYIISYDMFDTLVFRYCNEPNKIFDIVANKINNPNFKKDRMQAEGSMFRPTIDDIYNVLNRDYNYDLNIKNIEIETEIENIYPNNELFLKLREIDIIVSDMYLLEEHLRLILEKCNQHNPEHLRIDFSKIKIYVSPGGKAQGWIWNNISEKNLIKYHIGDNYNSDYIKTLENNIDAVHYYGTPYSNNEIILINHNNLELANLCRYLRLTNIYFNQIEHQLYNLSVNINIPILLLTCKFLENKNILFFLRDCYYLKIFYDLLYNSDTNFVKISRLCLKNSNNEYINYLNNLIKDDTIFFDIQATGNSLNNFYNNFPNVKKCNLYTISSRWKNYDLLNSISNSDKYIIFECLNSNFLYSYAFLENNVFRYLNYELDKKYINIIMRSIILTIKFLINNNININFDTNIINILSNIDPNIEYDINKYIILPEHKNDDIVPRNYRINIISFHTMNYPFDYGLNLIKTAKLFKNLYDPYFDSFTMYNTEKCLKFDPNFVNNYMTYYPNLNFGEHKRGNCHGFWKWKPFIIKYHLDNINYNEILIYQDCNVIKYNNYIEYIEDYTSNVEFLFNILDIDILIPIELPGLLTKYHCKHRVFEHIGELNDYYMNFPLLNANRIFIRKTDLSIRFINEWLNYCLNDGLILPEDRNEPELRWHTHDQAILTVLYRKYIKLNLFKQNAPGFYIKDKIFKRDNIIFI